MKGRQEFPRAVGLAPAGRTDLKTTHGPPALPRGLRPATPTTTSPPPPPFYNPTIRPSRANMRRSTRLSIGANNAAPVTSNGGPADAADSQGSSTALVDDAPASSARGPSTPPFAGAAPPPQLRSALLLEQEHQPAALPDADHMTTSFDAGSRSRSNARSKAAPSAAAAGKGQKRKAGSGGASQPLLPLLLTTLTDPHPATAPDWSSSHGRIAQAADEEGHRAPLRRRRRRRFRGGRRTPPVDSEQEARRVSEPSSFAHALER